MNRVQTNWRQGELQGETRQANERERRRWTALSAAPLHLAPKRVRDAFHSPGRSPSSAAIGQHPQSPNQLELESLRAPVHHQCRTNGKLGAMRPDVEANPGRGTGVWRSLQQELGLLWRVGSSLINGPEPRGARLSRHFFPPSSPLPIAIRTRQIGEEINSNLTSLLWNLDRIVRAILPLEAGCDHL